LPEVHRGEITGVSRHPVDALAGQPTSRFPGAAETMVRTTVRAYEAARGPAWDVVAADVAVPVAAFQPGCAQPGGSGPGCAAGQRRQKTITTWAKAPVIASTAWSLTCRRAWLSISEVACMDVW